MSGTGDLCGDIFEIKRFAVHDGSGIRTTLFLKGCPLRCVWCHNPEGLSRAPQLACYAHRCIDCGSCVSVCPEDAHRMEAGAHTLDRTSCRACGACAEVCPGGALVLYGKKMTVEELLPLLLEDRDFYANSGGGVTLSGGECLLQAAFCAELLRQLRAEGISTAVDTCGAVPWSEMERVVPYTDAFLYDLKAADEGTHIRGTGHSNRQILENLKRLDACGKSIEIRIPFVPEWNSGEIEGIGRLLADLRSVTGIRLLPYHDYMRSKYAALELSAPPLCRLPTETELVAVREALHSITGLAVRS